LVKKKYEIRVITKDTIRAPERSAIVLIEDTTKIFWLKNNEYNPNVYTAVKIILEMKSVGVRK